MTTDASDLAALSHDCDRRACPCASPVRAVADCACRWRVPAGAAPR